MKAYTDGQPVKWYHEKFSGATMDHPAWQRLESRWIALSRLVEEIDPDDPVEVELLAVSGEALRADKLFLLKLWGGIASLLTLPVKIALGADGFLPVHALPVHLVQEVFQVLTDLLALDAVGLQHLGLLLQVGTAAFVDPLAGGVESLPKGVIDR